MSIIWYADGAPLQRKPSRSSPLLFSTRLSMKTSSSIFEAKVVRDKKLFLEVLMKTKWEHRRSWTRFILPHWEHDRNFGRRSQEKKGFSVSNREVRREGLDLKHGQKWEGNFGTSVFKVLEDKRKYGGNEEEKTQLFGYCHTLKCDSFWRSYSCI